MGTYFSMLLSSMNGLDAMVAVRLQSVYNKGVRLSPGPLDEWCNGKPVGNTTCNVDRDGDNHQRCLARKLRTSLWPFGDSALW